MFLGRRGAFVFFLLSGRLVFGNLPWRPFCLLVESWPLTLPEVSGACPGFFWDLLRVASSMSCWWSTFSQFVGDSSVSEVFVLQVWVWRVELNSDQNTQLIIYLWRSRTVWCESFFSTCRGWILVCPTDLVLCLRTVSRSAVLLRGSAVFRSVLVFIEEQLQKVKPMKIKLTAVSPNKPGPCLFWGPAEFCRTTTRPFVFSHNK